MLITVFFAVMAYLTGSLSSAIIVCRLAGLPDPRTQGSGNPGATNVLRFGGKKLAATVLAGDILKGLIPVIIARLLALDAAQLAVVGVAAFGGHLYPVFFRFQGGKGVATSLGVMLGLTWQVALLSLGIWLLMSAIFRISSLAAISAAVVAPLLTWWLEANSAYVIAIALMSLTLLWRHRRNIRNLLAGMEPKIGS